MHYRRHTEKYQTVLLDWMLDAKRKRTATGTKLSPAPLAAYTTTCVKERSAVFEGIVKTGCPGIARPLCTRPSPVEEVAR